MPPNRYSRYSFTAGYLDNEGHFLLTDREPYRFVQFSDTIAHRVSRGDSLFTLAATTYAGMRRPAGLWWVIADFQPTPIIDPTIALPVAQFIFIPSMRTLIEEVLDEGRRSEAFG